MLEKHILAININENFVALLNTTQSNTFKIVNSLQFDFIKKKDNEKQLKPFIRKNNISQNQLENFIAQLESEKLLYKNENLTFNSKYKKYVDFWVHTTDNCNLNCSYCNVQTKPLNTTISKEVLNELSGKLLKLGSENQLEKVNLRFAGGEPLLKFELLKEFIIDLKTKLSKYNVHLSAGLLTNLTLLNQNIIDFIKIEKIGVGVSLDGLENYHDTSRCFKDGRGSFEVTVNNIMQLKKNNIPFGIMTTVTNKNLEGLLDFCKFLTENRFKFRLSFVHQEEINKTTLFEVLENCYNYFEDEISKGYEFSKYHQLGELKIFNPASQNCLCGIASATLYTNGDIFFCQQVLGTDMKVSSIFDDIDIYETIGYGKKYIYELSYECIECEYKNICNGGCNLERINNKSPYCNIYKHFIPKIIQLIGKERLYKIEKSIETCV